MDDRWSDIELGDLWAKYESSSEAVEGISVSFSLLLLILGPSNI
jgi:hypothetical protein